MINDLSDEEFAALVDLGVKWQMAGRPPHDFESDGRPIERCRQCARSRVQHGESTRGAMIRE